jgi:hypothetical protein
MRATTVSSLVVAPCDTAHPGFARVAGTPRASAHSGVARYPFDSSAVDRVARAATVAGTSHIASDSVAPAHPRFAGHPSNSSAFDLSSCAPPAPWFA